MLIRRDKLRLAFPIPQMYIVQHQCAQMYQNGKHAALQSDHVEPEPDERPTVHPWYAADGASSRGGSGTLSEPGRPVSELSRVGAGRRATGAGVRRSQS